MFIPLSSNVECGVGREAVVGRTKHGGVVPSESVGGVEGGGVGSELSEGGLLVAQGLDGRSGLGCS